MAKQQVVKVPIAGSEWIIRFTPHMQKHFGWVNYDDREILISTKQTPSELLDTVIHEVLHVLLPFGSEEFVSTAASDLAGVLDSVDLEG